MIEIDMKDQVQEAINSFEESGDKLRKEFPKNPACNKLFNVKHNSKNLDGKRSDIFHSLVAKLLYICKQARPDIVPTISYLTNREAKSNVDDRGKLKQFLGYLKRSINKKCIIDVQSLKAIFTWIDAAQ